MSPSTLHPTPESSAPTASPSLFDLRREVETLAHPHQLRPLLNAIRNDVATLRQVAAQSYEHENGFAKVMLRCDQGFKLRLHVWRPGAGQCAQENIHDHRWDFASAVLTGELRTETFELASDDGMPEAERVQGYRYVRGAPGTSLDYGLVPIGPVHVTRSATHRIREGESYALSRTVLHRIVQTSAHLTATLVLTAPPQAHDCSLLSRREMALSGRNVIRPLDAAQLRDLLDLAAEWT